MRGGVRWGSQKKKTNRVRESEGGRRQEEGERGRGSERKSREVHHITQTGYFLGIQELNASEDQGLKGFKGHALGVSGFRFGGLRIWVQGLLNVGFHWLSLAFTVRRPFSTQPEGLGLGCRGLRG